MKILFVFYLQGTQNFQLPKKQLTWEPFFRFISKPWNTDELRASVNQAIRHFDLVEENSRLLEETTKRNEELEILNRKLKDMFEVQKEFTSTVSHELRTPLASIKSTVDLVLSETPGKLNENQIKFLTKSKSNVDRLSRLINDILDLTKLESGKAQLNIESHDMRVLIQDVLDVNQTVATEKGLYLKGDIPSDLPSIFF